METIYVDPENYGIDSGKLREMLEVLEKEAELHSISVKYEGKTILEGAWKPFYPGGSPDDAFSFQDGNGDLCGFCPG